MKGILKARGRANIVPGEDLLTRDALDAVFYGQSGLPSTADSIAYDPEQKLLAFGTSDGRVKVSGGAGAEQLLVSSDRSGTAALCFLSRKAALLRVTKAGDLELWGLCQGTLLDNMPCADPAVSVAVVPNTPYICLGCQSGMLQFLQVNNASGEPAEGVTEAHSLELLPYELHADDLEADGELTSLSVLNVGDCQHLLGVHSNSGAFVWELRHQVCLVKTSEAVRANESIGVEGEAQMELGQSGPARTACWVGSQAEIFATGHEMGQVLVWMIPLDASGHPSTTAVTLQLVMKLLVSPPEELAMPVTRLQFVEGDNKDRDSSLLIFGGQNLDQPPILSLASLDSSHHGKSAMRTLPWYGMIHGFALVPHKGAISASAPAAGIIVLMEFGHVVLFELPDLNPHPSSLPLQELPELTHCLLAESSPPSTSDGDHSVSLEQLRAVQCSTPLVGAGQRWQWAFNGGAPASPALTALGQSDILLTGHSDGRVRLWEATTAVPDLRATVPFDSGGAGPKLKPVSALQFCATSGLLVVAHLRGEVRVYQFSSTANEVVTMESSGKSKRKFTLEEDSGRRQPPGFQRMLRLCHHQATVTAVDIAASVGVVACSDEAGNVSVTDLKQPSVLHFVRAWDQQIANISIVGLNQEQTNADGGNPGPAESQQSLKTALLIATSAKGGLTALDLTSGRPVGSKILPKSPDCALLTAVLDGRGSLVTSQAEPLSLAWPKNSTSPKASYMSDAAGAKVSHISAFRSQDKAACSPESPSADPFHLKPAEGSGESFRRSSSEDEDSFLANAAQEVESSREHGQKKLRLKTLFKEGKNRMDTKHGTSRSTKEDPSMSPKTASRQRPEAGHRGLASPDSLSKVLSKPSSFRNRNSGTHQPSTLNGSEESEAQLIVVATQQYLRVYPLDSLLDGDRTTLKKVTLEKPCAAAGVLSIQGAPGLACISTDGTIQVFSMPGLDHLYLSSIGDIAGFPWSWEASMAPALQQLCSISRSGEIAAPAKGGELVRISLTSTGLAPARCTSLYDWDLAHAASAARQPTSERHRAASGELAEAGSQDSAETSGDSHGADGGADALRPGHAEHKKGLGGFFNHVKGGVVGVGGLVEGTGRGLGHSISGIMGSGRRESRANHRSNAPPLNRVLSKQKLGSPPRLQASGHVAEKARPNSQQTMKPGPPVRQPPVQGERPSARSELLAGRERPPRRGVRTANEIKEAYGRPTSKKMTSVAGLAAENVVKLEERGEKLNTINTKAEAMANDAQDFASMARKIRDREAAKRWWQL